MNRDNEKGIRNIFKSAGLLLLLNLFASALNYGYQIILARVLSVDAFGTMCTVFSVMMLVAVPGSTFTMLCAKDVSQYCSANKPEEAWRHVQNQLRLANLFAVIVLILGAAFHRPLQIVLKVDDTYILMLIVFACALGYYHPLFSGCMSGMKRFFSLGIYALLIPFYKLLGLTVAASVEAEKVRLHVILYSIVLGSIATAVAGYFYLFCKLAKTKMKKHHKEGRPKEQGWIDSMIINICLAVYINIDILAVRSIAGETVGGLYSAANLFGKMVYYCATSIGTVLLPIAATASVQEAGKILKKVLLLACIVSTTGLLLLNLIKRPLIILIYGEAYQAAAQYIAPVSLISFSIGVLTILTNFFVGRACLKIAKWGLLALAGSILILTWVVSDIYLLLTLIGLAGILCSICFVFGYYFQKT